MRSAESTERKLVDEIRARAALDVAIGFDSDEEIVESVVAIFDGEMDDAHLRQLADEFVAAAANAHGKAQAAWPKETDCDLLDRAFSELNRSGIVARQHFSCCGTCGVREIYDEMDHAAEQGQRVRGYTFFHVQDSEHAVDGGGLFLNYGSTEEGEAAAVAIGHEIVDALERHGLKTTWNGDWSKRINVSIDWKRRRAPH